MQEDIYRFTLQTQSKYCLGEISFQKAVNSYLKKYMALVHAERAFIASVDDSKLEILASNYSGGSQASIQRKLVSGQLKKLITQKTAVSGVGESTPLLDNWDEFSGFPLVHGDKLNGVICLDRRVNGKEITEAESLLSQSLAVLLQMELNKSEGQVGAERVSQRYRHIQKTARIGFWTWSQTEDTFWSEEIYRIFGLKSNQTPPTFKEIADSFVAPEDRKKYLDHVKRAIDSKEKFELTYSIIRPNGRRRVVASKGTYDEDGQLFEGIIQDVTNFNDIEQSLAAQIRTTDDILQNMMVGVIRINMEGTITYANDSAARFLNEKKSNIIGRNYIRDDIRAIYLDDKPVNLDEYPLAKSLNDGLTISNYTHGLKLPDGQVKWFSLNSAPLYDEKGDQIGVVANFNDISEEIETRKLLEESQYQYKLVAENSKDLVALHNMDGSYAYISPNIIDVLGYQPKELKKMTPFDLIHKEDLVLLEDSHKKVLDGLNNTIRYRFKHKGGQYLWFETFVKLIRENDEPKYIQNTTRYIHEQKIAEDKLIESEKRFRKMINEAPISIEIYHKNGDLIMANDHWEKLWGIKKEEVIGQFNLLTSDTVDKSRIQRLIKDGFKGKRGEYKQLAYPAEEKNKFRYFNNSFFPLENQEGKFEDLVIISDEVTDEVNAEKRLKESEERFRAMAENLPGAIYLLQQDDKKWRTVYINDEIKKITGYTRKEFLDGKIRLNELIDPADLKVGLAQQKKALTKRQKFIVEYEIKTKSGDWRWIKDTGTGIYEGKKLKYVEGYIEDITERKQYISRVESSELRFRTLFEDSSQGILISDQEGQILECNKMAKKILGYTKAELSEMSLKDITHPADFKISMAKLKETLGSRSRSFQTEKRFRKKNGELVWVRFDGTHFIDPDSGNYRIVGLFQDITSQRKAIKEIQSRELRFQSIFNDSGHGVALMNTEGQILEANKKYLQMLGITKQRIKEGLHIKDFVHPEDLPESKKTLKTVVDGSHKNYQGERRIVTTKGKVIWVRVNITTFNDPMSEELQVVAILEDISARRDAVEKLRISEEFQHETINAMPIALLVMDRSGLIKQTNAVWDKTIAPNKHLTGGVMGKNLISVLKKAPQGETILSGLEDVISGKINMLEMEICFGAENEYWYSIRATLLDPKFDSLVLTMQDITVRRRIELALEESLDKYRKIYNKTPVMMHSIDPNGFIVSVSDFWLIRMGYQRHEVIGKYIGDFVTKQSKQEIKKNMPTFFRTGSMFNVSYQFVTKNGAVLDTLVSAIKEGKGKSLRSLGVVNDITQLKQTQSELEVNEKHLLEAQRMAKLGNFDLNLKSGNFSSSEVFDEILELNEKIPKDLSLVERIIPVQDRTRLAETFSRALDNDEEFEYLGRFITLKSKKHIWFEGLGRVIRVDGKPTRFVGTIQDITKSYQSELKIQRLSDRLSLATESAGIGVWELDHATGKVHWEDTMYTLYQIEQPYEGNPWNEVEAITHHDDKGRVKQMLEDINTGKELIDADYRLELKEGERHFRSVIRQLKNEDGTIHQTVGVSFDITKDKELLDSLESSLKEKDTLIKEVHHRVKNNMQMVSSILALKSLDLTDEESKNVFDDCTNRIKSMAVVHDQLYRFYNVSEIDIDEYLDHLLRGLNVLLGGGDFSINVTSDNDTMDVDRALLVGLIISEIVGNAFKHGFKGLNEGNIDISFKVKKDKRIINVINDGHPIPKDIFERQTASLGMSLIKTFTRQLEGEIKLHPDKNGFELVF